MNIFFLFEREYERSQVESIWELRLPIERVKKELEELAAVHYLSNSWIYTQLRRYEEELGAQLFRKDSSGCGPGSFYLSICDRMLTFSQKQHLYVSDKIKVANGAYDKITNEAAERSVRVFLGAGSTLYHLANIMAERSCQQPPAGPRCSIRTHNLGALRRLLEPAVNHERLAISLPEGRVDPVTYAVLSEPAGLAAQDFDYLIMGTSFILEERLYVESAADTELNAAFLRRFGGQRILLLTKHEFTDQERPGLKPFGRLADYDCGIVPRHSAPGGGPGKKYEAVFEGYQGRFQPEIIHWNYSILRIRKD